MDNFIVFGIGGIVLVKGAVEGLKALGAKWSPVLLALLVSVFLVVMNELSVEFPIVLRVFKALVTVVVAWLGATELYDIKRAVGAVGRLDVVK